MSGRLLIGIAGQVIGNALFPGIGGAIGWLAGSLIGGLLFPPDGQNTSGISEQPRLQDQQITGASIGAPLPLVFGTMRLAGEVIWAGELIEEETTETSTEQSSGGGKGLGGPQSSHSQTTITRKYYRSFAICFGEGVADDVLKIWFDGNKVMDKTTDEEDTLEEGIVYSFYRGTEDQLPDPIIQQDKGADRTPAFRGLCYMVFDRLPVSDYRIPMPNVTAEISFNATPNRTFRRAALMDPSISDHIATGSLTVDWTRQRAYVYGISPSHVIRRFNTRLMAEDFQVLNDDVIDQTGGPWRVFGNGYVTPDGGVVYNLGASNSAPIVRLHADSLQETSRFGDQSTLLGMTPDRFELSSQFWHIRAYGLLGPVDFLVVGSVFASVGVLTLPNLDYLWDSDTTFSGIDAYARFESGCQGASRLQHGFGYFAMGPAYAGADSGDIAIYQIYIHTILPETPTVGVQQGDAYVEVELLTTLSPDETLPGETTLAENGSNMVYDATDDTIIFHAIAGSNGEGWWVKYDPNSNQILWRVNITLQLPWRFSAQSRVRNGTLGFIVNGTGVLINTRTGEILTKPEAPFWTAQALGAPGFYDSNSQSFIIPTIDGGVNVTRFFFNRSTSGGVGVDHIVRSICQREAIPDIRIDVTDIAGLSIHGYMVGRQLNGAQALGQLLQYFQVDVVESDYRMKFTQRGKSPSITLTPDDYKPRGETEDPISTTLIPDVELPERFTVTYIDPATDYQQDARSAKRVRNPTPSMSSNNKLSISIAGALTATQALQQAEKLLYTAWNESGSYEVQTHWGLLKYDPTDVVTLTLSSGVEVRARITQANLGVDLAYELNLLGEVPSQYTSAITGNSSEGFIPKVIHGPSAIKLFVIDSPLLLDSDETLGRITAPIYVAMSGYSENQFDQGYLYVSSDGQTYEPAGSVFGAAAKWGTTIAALGDPDPQSVFATDNVNTIDVLMAVGGDALESVSQADLLNGRNAAALLKANGEVEILQYQTVGINPSGTYTLSGLIRGMRGTDTMAYGHTSGETFILLEGALRNTVPCPVSDLGTPKYFRAVGRGQRFEDAEVVGFTATGRALMPYRPVHEAAAANGNDIDLTWERRSRIGAGGLRNELDTVPLGETSEAYEIDIYDGPGGSVVRTVAGVATPAHTYTEADQTTDGFIPPLSEITVAIYQVSAEVGRGFGAEVTLRVT